MFAGDPVPLLGPRRKCHGGCLPGHGPLGNLSRVAMGCLGKGTWGRACPPSAGSLRAQVPFPHLRTNSSLTLPKLNKNPALKGTGDKWLPGPAGPKFLPAYETEDGVHEQDGKIWEGIAGGTWPVFSFPMLWQGTWLHSTVLARLGTGARNHRRAQFTQL